MTEDKQPTDHPRHPGSPSAAVAAAVAAAAAQTWSRLAGLARASFQTQARLTEHSVELIWATVARNLDRTSANKAYVESVARESALYWRAVGDLGVDFVAGLIDLGKGLSTTVLRRADQRENFASRP